LTRHQEVCVLEQWQRALRIATANEPADLLLRGGRIVNVFTGEIEQGSIAIADGRVVGIGDYDAAEVTIDLDGAFVAPSFIDGHFHTESSLLWITQFARAVVPHGTGAIVTDPHEIVNVAGLTGFNALVEASRDLPLAVYFTVPSCVPASPRETAGAIISAADIAEGLSNPAAVGLGEMMNFPGVLGGDPEIYSRLEAARGRLKDGHAPGITGRSLDAYALSGMTSDHESTSREEGREKLRRGMMLMIREGSTEHNLRELLPLVNDQTWARCCFASDDRDCTTLLHDGHMNQTLRLAVSEGLDPVRAIRMATFNVADYWRLDRIGAIAPGYWANLIVLDDLRDFGVREVYWQGQAVARAGQATFDVRTEIPAVLRDSVHIPELTAEMMQLRPEDARRAVGTIDGQIVTKLLEVEPKVVDGAAVPDIDRDLLKLVCVERHRATGNVGVGYVNGFGLQRGAMATSIAHDAHNIVAVGTNDDDILGAIRAVAASQGGLAAVAGGQMLAHLALPVAGILSDQSLEVTAAGYHRMEVTARELGSTLHSPFGLLAFMALSVIPEARVTDQGFITL
jgi:adenine deaminase